MHVGPVFTMGSYRGRINSPFKHLVLATIIHLTTLTFDKLSPRPLDLMGLKYFK